MGDTFSRNDRIALPTSAAFRSYESFFELDDDDARLPVEALVGEALAWEDAAALYATLAERTAEAGLAPALVAADAWGGVGWPDYVSRSLAKERALASRASVDAFFRARSAAFGGPLRIGPALERLAARLGGDLETKLSRVDPEALAAFEAGGDDGDGDEDDENGLWVDDELPLEPRARYEADVARRAAFLASAPRRGGLALAIAARPYDAATALAEMAFGAARVVLIACEPHELPLYLGFGGFNDCPEPHEHALVWARWGARCGARPVAFGRDRIEGILARPPADLGEHAAFVGEQLLYDPDAGVEGVLALVGATYRAARASFWWDL